MTDVRYALRLVIRQPLFALVVVGTLTLGIGGATAMFSIVHGVLLKSLPYADPDRLVWMFGAFRLNDSAAISPPDFVDYRARQESFESIAAMMIAPSGVTVDTAEGPERLQATSTTAGFLTTLGVRPAIGRDFEVRDESLSATPVVLISQRLWRQRYDGVENLTLGDGLRGQRPGREPARQYRYQPARDRRGAGRTGVHRWPEGGHAAR